MKTRSAIGAVFGLGLVGSLVLAGCGAASPGSTASSSTTTPAASSSSPATSTSTSATATATTGASTGSVAGAFTLKYDTAGFLAPGQSGPQPGFGPNHDLDNESAPKPGPYSVTAGSTKVSFLFPKTVDATTPPNDVLEVATGSQVTVDAPAGKYHNIYFLAAVAGGPQPANVTLNYTDGSKQTVDVGFDDWCTLEIGNTPVTGTYPAWQGVTRIGEADGSSNNVSGGGYTGTEQGCGLYVSSVKADPTKTLKSLVIDNSLTAVPADLPDITKVSTNARIGIVAITGV